MCDVSTYGKDKEIRNTRWWRQRERWGDEACMQGKYQCVKLWVSRLSRGWNKPNLRLAQSPTLQYWSPQSHLCWTGGILSVQLLVLDVSGYLAGLRSVHCHDRCYLLVNEQRDYSSSDMASKLAADLGLGSAFSFLSWGICHMELELAERYNPRYGSKAS